MDQNMNFFASDFPRDVSESSLKFAKVTEKLLRIDLDGRVIIKLGSAIAHYGDVKFNRLPPLKAKGLEEKALEAIRPLVSAEGKGRLYCARQGCAVRIIKLSAETVNISASEVLAFDESLNYEMFVIGEGVSIVTGGVFAVKFSGTGSLAIAVHGIPTVLPVTPGNDLFTDPHATIAWTDGLEHELSTDLTWRDFIGKSSKEAVQLHFSGNGEVVIQPSEDPAKFTLKSLKALL